MSEDEAAVPSWNGEAYSVKGTLQLPYAEISEPFAASYDPKKKKSRIDYYGGKNILFVCLMVFNATFNNISVISWWSVLLMDETGGPGENHRPVASH